VSRQTAAVILIAIIISALVSFVIAYLVLSDPNLFGLSTKGVQGPKGDTGPQGLPGEGANPGTVAAPAMDTGWIDFRDKAGQSYSIIHNLNSSELIVDITGKTTATSNVHQKYLGLTGCIPGWTNTLLQKTYAFSGVYSLCKTLDGGFAATASVDSDVLLVKTDSNGETLWNKTYGGSGYDRGYSVVQTFDGGYIVAGQTNSFGYGKSDFYLLKVGSDGALQWNKTYGGTDDDYALSVFQTSDTGLAIVGTTRSFGAGSSDIFLVKTDSYGNALWTKTFGGTYSDEGTSIIQTPDNGLVICGWTTLVKNNYYYEGAYWAKTDSAGNVLWTHDYEDGYDSIRGYSVILASDGGLVIAGTFKGTSSGSIAHGFLNAFFIKTESDGNQVIDYRRYGGETDKIREVNGIIQTSDGGYAIVGSGVIAPNEQGKADKICIIKTSSNGDEKGIETYDVGTGRSIVQTSDGAYVVGGGVLLMKTDVIGDFGLAQTSLSDNVLTLYRGADDIYWNYVRVRIWKVTQP
jgi:hypothetical protein